MTSAERWWCIIDSRTMRRASMGTYLTQESAERQIRQWTDRDAAGGRPDIHDVIPYLVVRDLASDDAR